MTDRLHLVSVLRPITHERSRLTVGEVEGILSQRLFVLWDKASKTLPERITVVSILNYDGVHRNFPST